MERLGAPRAEARGSAAEASWSGPQTCAPTRGAANHARAAHLGEIRLVHEFSGCDATSDRAGIGQKAAGLIRLPYTGGIAGALAHCERCHDLCVHRLGEVDDAAPLLAGQDAVEPCRWRLRRARRHAAISSRTRARSVAPACHIRDRQHASPAPVARRWLSSALAPAPANPARRARDRKSVV